jgi:ubiquinone/menaquinone biosynthesis C-methylase UbiE
MSWYAEHVFPHLMNKVMDTKQTRAVRKEVCAGLAGDVVEIGFGTGHNLPYLPATVRSLRVVEPSGVGVRLAADRIAASAVPVQVSGLDGQALPFDDGTADMVLCTWSLCSITDPVQAVREMRRVLRPGGVLHFAEHGRAPDPGVLRWQRRLNPVQKRCGAGCHLDRDIPAILAEGGLVVRGLVHRYEDGMPRAFGSLFSGEATPA